MEATAPTTPAAPAPDATETQVEPHGEATKPAEPSIGEKYRRLEAEHAKKVKEQILERRKWDADRKTTGERLSRLAELEKQQQSARLNPPAFLKSIYGDDWHTIVNEAKLNGVPPADLIQSEMARMREEFESKLRERDEGETKRSQQHQTAALEQARNNIRLESEDFYEASGAEYPILERIGDKAEVARRIAQRIEAEFHKTTRRDESGAVLRQGRVLTPKEAAELIEGEMLSVAEAAMKSEKYKARLTPPDLTSEKKSGSLKLKQQSSTPQQQPSGQPQPSVRKTLSNDIKGSTPDAAPVIQTPEERRKRALAAFDAARAKKDAAR